MIVTEKKSTAKLPGRHIQGVLFLTAGYGSRAEPLSFCRPKALLPFGGETTLLGNLVNQFAVAGPDKMVFNASRCPGLVMEEGKRYWSGKSELLFEQRPLGLPGTLSRNQEMFDSHWIISNTDMAIDIPVKELVDFHLTSGSEWTVLTGDFPVHGSYGSLNVGGISRHYLGVSVISPNVVALAAERQLSTGFFSELRSTAEEAGIVINEFYTKATWLDMGEVQLFRKNLLEKGSYIHPSARIDKDVSLEGFYWIGSYCIISHDVVLRNSVMLEGSELLPGSSLVDDVLPWFSRRS